MRKISAYTYKVATESPSTVISCVTVPASLVSVRGGREFVGAVPLTRNDST